MSKRKVNKKSGKKFEEISHTVVKSLNPKSEVYRNVRVEGKLSKVKREVDIQLVNPTDYDFIAFECKDYGRPVDVPVVEGFNTKLQDIQAKKGAIVANSPYSKAAQNMASALGIDLLNLVNTKDENIRCKLFMDMLLSDTSLKSFRLRIRSSSPQITIPLEVTKVIFEDENGKRGTAYEIFASLWNETESSLMKVPGFYEYRPPNPTAKRIIGLNGEIIVPTEIVFIYEVVEKHYAGKIEVIETQGLYDVKRQAYQTRSMQTAPMIAHEFETKWPEISAEEAEKAKLERKFGMAVSCSSLLQVSTS